MQHVSDKWYSPNIDRAVIKELKKRSDAPGWQHMIIFFSLLALAGAGSVYTYGGWWFLLPSSNKTNFCSAVKSGLIFFVII